MKSEVEQFADWSMPWKFIAYMRTSLAARPEELARFEKIYTEISDPTHWRSADLAFACKIAHNEAKRRFPEAEDEVVAAIVRASSYDWR
jgi:hypothetical protein